MRISDWSSDVCSSDLHKVYLEILEKEITKAFVYAYEEQAETLFQNYLDHAEAYVNETTVKDRNTREELQPDKNFLKTIEEQVAIVGPAADGFRQRSEEHTSELQSLMRTSYAVFC